MVFLAISAMMSQSYDSELVATIKQQNDQKHVTHTYEARAEEEDDIKLSKKQKTAKIDEFRCDPSFPRTLRTVGRQETGTYDTYGS